MNGEAGVTPSKNRDTGNSGWRIFSSLLTARNRIVEALSKNQGGAAASRVFRGSIPPTHSRRERGQGLVEFSVVTLMTVIMLLFVVEISRMVLVYTSVANAARAGLRYAIVHGSTRPTSGCANASDCASGPGQPCTCPQVAAVVKNFASAGLLSTSRLLIKIYYPGAAGYAGPFNDPGQPVKISVVYPYDPLTNYFSTTLSVPLASATQGVIVF